GPEVIVEPPEPVEIKLDSIMLGTLYNVTIGDNAESVYADLQIYAKGETPIGYLGITGQFNDRLEDLENRIILYRSLVLDRKPSAKEGGQIYFANDVIKEIYNRDGVKLKSWPNSSSGALKVGDPVNSIYRKLIDLRRKPHYAGLLEYI